MADYEVVIDLRYPCQPVKCPRKFRSTDDLSREPFLAEHIDDSSNQCNEFHHEVHHGNKTLCLTQRKSYCGKQGSKAEVTRPARQQFMKKVVQHVERRSGDQSPCLCGKSKQQKHHSLILWFDQNPVELDPFGLINCGGRVFRRSATLPWIFAVDNWIRGQQVWVRRRRLQHWRSRRKRHAQCRVQQRMKLDVWMKECFSAHKSS